MKRQLESAVANRGQSPGAGVRREVAEVNTSNHYTSQPLTAERVAALDRGEMRDFYRARFSNAADFTFFMVGAFNVVRPFRCSRATSAGCGRPARARPIQDVKLSFPSAVRRSASKRDASRAAGP
jgi:hypothetical protein